MRSIRAGYHDNESISFLGSKIWNILPDEFKQQTSLKHGSHLAVVSGSER